MLRFTVAVFTVVLLSVIGSAHAQSVSLQTAGLRIELSPDGAVSRAWIGDANVARDFTASTAIAGCEQTGKTERNATPGGFEFRRTLTDPSTHASCRVVERFTSRAHSIRWDVEIMGQGGPWTAPIQTRLHYPIAESVGASGVRVWTAWASPQYDPATLDPSLLKQLKVGSWTDPLVPLPFARSLMSYGAPALDDGRTFIPYIPSRDNIFSIPLVSILEPGVKPGGAGLTCVLSPEDEVIDLTLETSRDGGAVFSRLFNRISAARPVRFSLDLTGHGADWRAGLGWMVRRYPGYFRPKNPDAGRLGGTGAYSNHSADGLDATRLRAMDFTVNWQASFDFPYMGMFIPPVAAGETWQRYGRGTTSAAHMEQYAARMKAMGFDVLNYFNVTEFGARVQFPPPSRQATRDADLWKNCNDFLYARLAKAILKVPASMNVTHPFYKKTKNGGPFYTWGDAVVLDCGDPGYRKFLLEQVRRHLAEIPSSSGFTIDRMDWLRLFNEDADDGVTWRNGKPARSLFNSWKRLMAEMGPLVHAASKNIFVNNHVKRIDLLEQADGIFDEFGNNNNSLNTTAFLCVQKPYLAWTGSAHDVADADGFFQKYLYLGAFPMCPFPGNDHAIQPGAADQAYLDYGPLLRLLEGREWVLTPGAVLVKDNTAKANIFRTPHGIVVCVVYGKQDTATLTLHVDGLQAAGLVCHANYPGAEPDVALNPRWNGGRLTLDVPLRRGCAVVTLKNPNPVKPTSH